VYFQQDNTPAHTAENSVQTLQLVFNQQIMRPRNVGYHHGMPCHQVVDGGDSLQMWRVAVNILNKQF